MNGKNLLIIAAAVLLAIVAYKVVFVPTSLRMQSSPNTIYAGSSSPVVLKAKLVNKLGLQVPFEHLSGKFVVDEGADKISILKTEDDELIFKTTGTTGRLVILFYSAAIAFPVEVVLNIRGSSVAGLV